MIDLSHTSSQIHHVTNFQDLVSIPFHGEINAICWTRKLVGDFSETEGITYNKKNDAVRTLSYNKLFLWTARQQQDLAENKIGIPELNLAYADLVENIGLQSIKYTLCQKPSICYVTLVKSMPPTIL